MSLKTIAIVCGGYSGERVISLQSAEVVRKNLPKDKYRPFVVDIGRSGWTMLHEGNSIPVDKNEFTALLDDERIRFDGVFSAIHGTPGEDGKLQGYFDMLQIPYANCGVLASAISFNKVFCNKFLSACGVRVAESEWIKRGEAYDRDAIIKRLGLPCFVKPTASGSSLGITKVKNVGDFDAAVQHAQAEGCDALVEAFLDGMEASCGCMRVDGVATPIAVTEIVPANEFFDFDAKYHNKATQEITPARIDQALYAEIMSTTKRIYNLLECRGLVRVDFIIDKKKGLHMVEPNSNPGLSEASILPQQAVYAGYTLSEFFDRALVEMFREVQA